MEQSKLQYLKNNSYIEFDKEEIRKELKDKRYSDECIERWINKYKYYRLMSDGQKMFYSEEYTENHTIEEIEKAFQKIN